MQDRNTTVIMPVSNAIGADIAEHSATPRVILGASGQGGGYYERFSAF